jgi:hypothetical protein
MTKKRIKRMSHTERLALINAPLPTFNTYGGHTWGGTCPLGCKDNYVGKKPTLEQLEGGVWTTKRDE